jgi:hypothetical protein
MKRKRGNFAELRDSLDLGNAMNNYAVQLLGDHFGRKLKEKTCAGSAGFVAHQSTDFVIRHVLKTI